MQEGTVSVPELAARVQQLAERWAAQVDEGLAGVAALTEREYRRACRELRDRRRELTPPTGDDVPAGPRPGNIRRRLSDRLERDWAECLAANAESEPDQKAISEPPATEAAKTGPKPRRERPVRQPTLPPSIDGPDLELPDAAEAMEWARAMGLVESQCRARRVNGRRPATRRD